MRLGNCLEVGYRLMIELGDADSECLDAFFECLVRFVSAVGFSILLALCKVHFLTELEQLFPLCLPSTSLIFSFPSSFF